jgi:beta-N-acetylhexosaminidase
MRRYLSLLSCLILKIVLLAQAKDSLDIKIGQMIMIGIGDRNEIKKSDPLLAEIKAHKLGGVVLFEKNITKSDSRENLKSLIAALQKHATIPLIVSIDEEGGKVHRLKEKYGFVSMPSANYIGRIDSKDSTIYYNRRLAAEMLDLGINFNYAPCLDLAKDTNNPAIAKKGRCFSADPFMVSKHAALCIQAHHDYKVKTILKHFPGHGSASGDSHLGIVDVTSTWGFEELLPYYEIIHSNSCDAIMTAHIINRNWDTTMLPATLSEKVVTGILRNLIGFKGVIFSDDMQMFAISKNYGFEKSLEMAINAGVDVLMFGNNVSPKDKPMTASELHAVIKQLVLDGKVSRVRIDESYKRIMRMKLS